MLSGKILDVVTNFDELTITISDKEAAESFLLLEGPQRSFLLTL